MKTFSVKRYECETCRHVYDTEEQARLCEKKPVTHDRGVKIGETVVITGGDCTGMRAKVESVSILSREWGHYAWKRYWHTVSLGAKVIDSYGHRMLTFDQYALESAQHEASRGAAEAD